MLELEMLVSSIERLRGGFMPKVGQRHFAYNKKGHAAAQKVAKRTGQKVQYKRSGGVARKR